MQLKQRSRHSFASGTYGTALTIRNGVLAWWLTDHSNFKQRSRHSFASGTYRTALTIRDGVLAWRLRDRSNLRIAHFARVRYSREVGIKVTVLYREMRRPLSKDVRKREHKFRIGKQEPSEETWNATQELPRVSVISRTHGNTEDNCQSGEHGDNMLLTYLLRRRAPTLAAAFCRDSNP